MDSVRSLNLNFRLKSIWCSLSKWFGNALYVFGPKYWSALWPSVLSMRGMGKSETVIVNLHHLYYSIQVEQHFGL